MLLRNTQLKKNIAYLLIALFFLNTIGVYFICKAFQLKIKFEVQDQIQEQDMSLSKIYLITLKISDAKKLNWSWFEQDSEFEYNGELYDVVKKVEHKNSISYYCIADSKESQIADMADRHVQYSMAHSNEVNNFKKLTEKLIYLPNITLLLISGQYAISDEPVFENIKSTMWVFSDVIVPPPKASFLNIRYA